MRTVTFLREIKYDALSLIKELIYAHGDDLTSCRMTYEAIRQEPVKIENLLPETLRASFGKCLLPYGPPKKADLYCTGYAGRITTGNCYRVMLVVEGKRKFSFSNRAEAAYPGVVLLIRKNSTYRLGFDDYNTKPGLWFSFLAVDFEAPDDDVAYYMCTGLGG